MRQNLFPTIALLALSLASCKPEMLPNPTVLADTAGHRFEWKCNEGRCRPASWGGIPRPDCAELARKFGSTDAHATVSTPWGRFVRVCGACRFRDKPGGVSMAFGPGACRLVACETTADCPQLYEYSRAHRFECVQGLCQSTDLNEHPRSAVRKHEAEELCSGPLPRLEGESAIEAQREAVRQLVGESCGSDPGSEACHSPLPQQCLQP